MFTLQEIAQICGGTLISVSPDTVIRRVTIDSREVQVDDLFVALHGRHLDGHLFLRQAYEKGAAAVLVEHVTPEVKQAIQVSNTLQALQRLARYQRARSSIPVVAVTGSMGKSTTKACLAISLSQVFRVCAGYRNWNNHIGVPLNLLRLSSSDECLVLELGANHVGEIGFLAELAQPTVGVITGVSPAHLEGFGSLDRVYQAKLELADYLSSRSRPVIANGDDPKLNHELRLRGVQPITYGTQRQCDFFLSRLTARDGYICFQVNGVLDFRLKGYGVFNAMNALAAIATASYFKLDLKALSQSWQSLPMLDHRFRLEDWVDRDIQIVDDAYNANPRSFAEAITSFQELAQDRRKIVVVGDMLELGGDAVSYHEELGRLLSGVGIDIVIGVGEMSQHAVAAFSTARPSRETAHFPDLQSACDFLRSNLRAGDSVFIKGSQALQLYELKKLLETSLKREAAGTAPLF